ncbi:hypothetical protein BH23ACT5_BH23ACT5_04450 [soil metagenome]
MPDERWRRRMRTIPSVVFGAAAMAALLPLTITTALVVDSVRWAGSRAPFMATRLVIFATVYLLAETVGLAAAAWSWATSPSRPVLERRTYAIQGRWAATLLTATERIFGLVIRAEGSEVVTPGPVLVLARHTSVVDNLLPARFVTSLGGIRLRYIMKRELLMDPALDVVGNRVPNVFVDRTGDSEASLTAIADLATGLGPNDGILMFPEGTRFTSSKLAKSLAVLERRSPRLHELGRELVSVMPPRVAGVSVLLDACRADVVVLAHRGLEGFARVADIWRGAMVGRTIDVKLWRISRDTIPDDRSDRAAWLFGVWLEIDRWVMAGPVEAT